MMTLAEPLLSRRCNADGLTLVQLLSQVGMRNGAVILQPTGRGTMVPRSPRRARRLQRCSGTAGLRSSWQSGIRTWITRFLSCLKTDMWALEHLNSVAHCTPYLVICKPCLACVVPGWSGGAASCRANSDRHCRLG